ncbi:BTB/POZ domain-containing protein KCTD5-like [Anopheles ziemanni]|uniref:BTB/POZ domain-containing protein KCTD5-like n=1 Tax=Anopheles ziemanni TaxID=345580 RepID=UPI00265E538E|nr:BTB/POZ domain-containing protein KCTD5-like [Anopheles ziemanni]
MEDSKWVTLNVGGVIFTTTRSTLTSREPNSMLARMFNTNQPIKSDRDAQGAYLIDRNHGFLVYDKHISLAGLSMEAKFYGFHGIMGLIEEEKRKEIARLKRFLPHYAFPEWQ